MSTPSKQKGSMADAQYEHIRAQILDTVYRSPPDGRGEAPMVTVDHPPPSEPMAVRITSSSRAYTYQLDRQLAKRKDLTEGPFDVDMGYRQGPTAEGGGGDGGDGGRTSINSNFAKARRSWQQRSSRRTSAAGRTRTIDIEAGSPPPHNSIRAATVEDPAGATDARTGSSPQWAHRIFDRFIGLFTRSSRNDDADECDAHMQTTEAARAA